MSRPISAMMLSGDNDSCLMIMVCFNPSEAYVSRDNKHIGFIEAGKLQTAPKTATPSDRECKLITRAYFALLVALDAATDYTCERDPFTTKSRPQDTMRTHNED